MINHNFPLLNLAENSKGVQVLPFETNRPNNTVLFESDLKKFLVTAYREYTVKAVKAASKVTGGSFTVHSKKNFIIPSYTLLPTPTNDTNQESKSYDNLPFFVLSLTFQLNEDIMFSGNLNYETIRNEIAKIISYSNIPGIRGNRGVFVTNLKLDESFSCMIFVSRAIFYNDYRVTVNFPASHEDYYAVIQSLSIPISQISQKFRFDLIRP